MGYKSSEQYGMKVFYKYFLKVCRTSSTVYNPIFIYNQWNQTTISVDF